MLETRSPKLRTVIDWRPYPEQKPPYDGKFLCQNKWEDFAFEDYSFDSEWICNEWPVTHFALPEDISITQEKREG